MTRKIPSRGTHKYNNVKPSNEEYCNGCLYMERSNYNSDECTEYAVCNMGFQIESEQVGKGFYRPYDCMKECIKARLKW